MERKKAIIYTHDIFHQNSAKTAHGLVRMSSRFEIVAIIDKAFEAGKVQEQNGIPEVDIPVYKTVKEFLRNGKEASVMIIGIANTGGILHRDWFPEIKSAIIEGMSIVNGLHQPLTEIPEFANLAAEYHVELLDIRKPRERDQLHFWKGEIFKVECPIIPVLGTDCAVGKRTTANLLTLEMRKLGYKAEMIYTGQTGWMQGWKYGFILDSTLNDFVSGELEHAIVSCYRQENPDVIFVEGQAALRNPSGPCGAEFLVSGNATGAILVHPPGRQYYKGGGAMKIPMKKVEDDIKLIEAFEVPVLGLALNSTGLSKENEMIFKETYFHQFNSPELCHSRRRKGDCEEFPVVLPLIDGVKPLTKPVIGILNKK